MVIQLNPEQEFVVDRAIEAGLIGTPDDVVQVGVDAIRLRLESRLALRRPLPSDEWVQQFHAWVHSHSSTAPLLSEEAMSRDAIYGTRGE